MAYDDTRPISRRTFATMAGLGLASMVMGSVAALAGDGGSSRPGEGGGAAQGYSKEIIWYDPHPTDPTDQSGPYPGQGWDADSKKFFVDMLEGTAHQDIFASSWPKLYSSEAWTNTISPAFDEALQNARQDLHNRHPDRYPDVNAIHARIVACAVFVSHWSTHRGRVNSRQCTVRTAWDEKIGTFVELGGVDPVLHYVEHLGEGWEQRQDVDVTDDSTWKPYLKAKYENNDARATIAVIAVDETVPASFGEMALTKAVTATLPELASAVTDNPCYDRSGATYEVFKDAACTQRANDSAGNPVTLTTKADGGTGRASVLVGDYWAREAQAPARGYVVDRTPAKATVTAGGIATFAVSDPPMYDPLPFMMAKVDREGTATAQGKAELKGAVYTMRYYKGLYKSQTEIDAGGTAPDAEATWATDADGHITMRDDEPSGGNWPYVRTTDDGAQARYMPLGTLTITETKAPTGYLRTKTTYVMTSEDDGTHTGAIKRTYYKGGQPLAAGQSWGDVEMTEIK